MQAEWLSAAAILSVAASNPAAASDIEKGLERDVVVAPLERGKVGVWDEGSLMMKFESAGAGHPASIIVAFRLTEDERLQSLLITSSEWKLDLTDYVRPLPNPFPTRIVVVPGSSGPSGSVRDFEVNLPYADDASKECMELYLEVSDAEVKSSARIKASSDEECSQ
jgi:hypothetical protein